MITEREYEFDCAYMKMAQAIAELSRAQRNKVGAIIVSKEEQVISQGFNGTPAGYDNCCEDKVFDGYDPCTTEKTCPHHLRTICLACKEYGIPRYKLVTRPEVLHAESNAISKCAKYNSSTDGARLYVTLSPCLDCSKLIIQSGIKKVIFLEPYRDLKGIEILIKCGIEVKQLLLDDNKTKWKTFIYINNELKQI